MTSASEAEPVGGDDCTSVSSTYGVLCERKGRHFGHAHEAAIGPKKRAVWPE